MYIYLYICYIDICITSVIVNRYEYDFMQNLMKMLMQNHLTTAIAISTYIMTSKINSNSRDRDASMLISIIMIIMTAMESLSMYNKYKNGIK